MTNKSFTLNSAVKDVKKKRESTTSIKSPEQGLKIYTSCRWLTAFSCCAMSLAMFSLRANISMAVVCMDNAALKAASLNNSGSANTSTLDDPPVTIPKEWLGFVFSAYYYGYIVTPLIGGMVAVKFGPRRVVGGSLLIVFIANMSTPIAIRSGIYIVIILRIIMGLASGVLNPGIQVLWSKWAPYNEKARLVAVSGLGFNLGNILATGIGGFLCEIPLDGGWPFVFYINGVLALLLMIFWWYQVYDSPQVHPRITQEEIVYIEHGKSSTKSRKISKIPWLRMVRSLPLWSIFVSHMSNSFITTLLATFITIYMNDVMLFKVTDNGLLSSLPFIIRFFMEMLFAVLVDFIISNNLASVTVSRKIFSVIGSLFPSAIFFGLGYITTEFKYLAVALISLIMCFQASNSAAFRVNHLDIAPRLAGPISGLSLTCASGMAISVPLITAALTTERTREQWQTVFFICGGVTVFASIFFFLFSSGTEQDWAKDDVIETDVADSQQEVDNSESRVKTLNRREYDNKAFIPIID